MKSLKCVALFVGGTAIGFVAGGVFVVKKAFESDVIRDAIVDILTKKIVTVIYGDDVQITRRPSKVSYRSYYDQKHRPPYEFNSDDIVFENRKDADKALKQLNDIVEKYAFATVSDLKDLADVAGSYIDKKYGWTDLQEAKVVVDTAKEGYILKLPKTIPIDW